MKHPNAKYGLEGSGNGRLSGVIIFGDLCKRQCDLQYPFNRTRRQNCKADCEAREGAGQQPPPPGPLPPLPPENEPDNNSGNGNGNGNETNTNKLIKKILFGFVALALLLILIWTGSAVYQKMTKK